MPLSQFVEAFRDGVVNTGTINGGGRKLEITDARNGLRTNVDIACHQATFLWCYRAAHDGAWPAGDQFMLAQGFVNGLIRYGHPTRVTENTIPLEGDVLIFTGTGLLQPGDHSCVMLGGGRGGAIAGYNQQGWFVNSGHLQASTYTVFPFDGLVWQSRPIGLMTRRRVMHGANEKYLWAVREGTAVAHAAQLP